MSTSNTQGKKTIVSSNFSLLSLMTNYERKILKKAYEDNIEDEGIQDGVNIIKYFKENQIEDELQEQLIDKVKQLESMPNNTLRHVMDLGKEMLKTNQDDFSKTTMFTEYIKNQEIDSDIDFVQNLGSELDSLKSQGALLHVVNLGEMALDQGFDLMEFGAM